MINWPLIILAFYIGYAFHRVLLNWKNKPVYSEQDLVMYGEQEHRKGYQQGLLEGRCE